AAEKQKTKALDQKEEDQDLINPNHVQKKVNISDLGAPRELSRRESSSQMHVAGKTDQAKADLGRLTKIKAERETVQAMKRKVCHFLVVKPTLTLSVAKAAELAAKQKAAAGLR
ncbi:hypothetical protein CPB85DRAFT_1238727, partial [Mucidula mucida]